MMTPTLAQPISPPHRGEPTTADPACYRRAFLAGLRPDPVETIDEWADAHLHLPSHVAEAGRWRTSRTPFLKEIMECLSPSHSCHKVVFMKPVQIGGTQAAINWVGYSIDRSPAPILLYEASLDSAKRLSREKLDPILEATPALKGKVKEARARDSGNTMFHKEFLGGFLDLLGTNSSVAARSTSAPRIILDEVDEYKQDVGLQGHPCDLIEKRSATYPRYKIFALSTPTIDGESRIAAEYAKGSRGRYYVPCPFCGELQHLQWERLIFTFDGVKRPDQAAYRCVGCERLIPEHYKPWMMDGARAHWIHENPDQEEIRSFHLNLLYQPYGWAYPWSRLAQEWLEATEKMEAGDHQPLKTFFNTILAQTWKVKVETINQADLYQRREQYAAACPPGVVVLTAAVDVQDDRLEAEICGWGAGEESWSIAYKILYGSPSLPQVWADLTDWLQQSHDHADGVALRVEAVGIDTGGHHTKEAYRFVERYRGLAYALKGSNDRGAPPIPIRRPRGHRRFRLQLYHIGTNALKDTIFPRLQLVRPGPGCLHFPERDEYDRDYFKGLASEAKKPHYVGKAQIQDGYKYEKQHQRNEPLDLKVYNLATLLLWLAARRTTLETLTAEWAKIAERAKVRQLPIPGTAEAGIEPSVDSLAPLPPLTFGQPRPGRRVLSHGV